MNPTFTKQMTQHAPVYGFIAIAKRGSRCRGVVGTKD